VADGFAENRVTGALGGKAPIVASGAGNTSHGKRIGIGVGCGITAVAGAPGGTAEVVASAAAANGVRLVAQIVTDHDGEFVGGEIVDGHGVGRALCLLNSVHPINHVNPVGGPV